MEAVATTSKVAHPLPRAGVLPQSEQFALQWVAWEKQQKELEKHREIIQRLSGGAQSGRASQVGFKLGGAAAGCCRPPANPQRPVIGPCDRPPLSLRAFCTQLPTLVLAAAAIAG